MTVNAPNMTPEEFRAEFARVLVPLVRDVYEKRLGEKKKRKPKAGGGKPSKDKDQKSEWKTQLKNALHKSGAVLRAMD